VAVVPFREIVLQPGTNFARTAPWLRDGLGGRLMYGLMLLIDARMEKTLQGTLAGVPCNSVASGLPVGNLPPGVRHALPDALAAVGDQLQIPRGLTEADASYAERLRTALDAWRQAGTARGLLSQELGALLSLTPEVRLVSTRYSCDPARLPFLLLYFLGTAILAASADTPIKITTAKPHGFVTGQRVLVTGVPGAAGAGANGQHDVTYISATQFSLNGSTPTGAAVGGRVLLTSAVPAATYPPARLSSQWDSYPAGRPRLEEPQHLYALAGGAGDWEWDDASAVTGTYGWWGAFLIIYSVAPNAWTGRSALWGSGALWGNGNAWGLNQSNGTALGLVAIARQWKNGNTWIRYLIVCFDSTLFDPTKSADGTHNPDGTFGRWSKIVGGARVRSRFAGAVYGGGTT
jgi:hypothetical protein